ncbi:F-box domain-containing protein [Mycena venus]|uniref:F-box domain-containing protein n=1 Tax=Mycena venus TaxID=2733690 RepID=A0A8H6Y1L3_9AGAR|nr:F-box domain-containing protein [Mycena venus]
MAGPYINQAHIQGLVEAKKKQIANRAMQIQNLVRLQEAEISELAALQLTVSPIGKLPTELLIKVFYLVVPPELFSDQGSDNTDQIVDGAHRVSQVCHHWREIAHGAPQLWVDGFRFSVSERPSRLELEQTTAWLERSHPLPITIYFHCTAGGNLDPGVGFKETELFRILLSTTRRWRHVIWDIPYLCPLGDLHPGDFEGLEQFTIENRDLRPPTKSLDVFLSATRLREVGIRTHGADQPDIIEVFHFPWKQLTSLTLEDGLSFGACRDIMLQCTSMRSMKIRSCSWDALEVSPAPPVVVLPFLNTLELHVDGLVATALGHLFPSLALPALKSLNLSFNDPLHHTVMWDTALFSEFQIRSPSVEKIVLTAQETAVAVENLLALVRHSPAVTDLTINVFGIDDVFVHGLQVKENDPHPLAPRLVTLALGHPVDASSDELDSALEGMIRSRWKPTGDSRVFDANVPRIASLKTVVFADRRNRVSQEFSSGLVALLEQGFDLIFK